MQSRNVPRQIELDYLRTQNVGRASSMVLQERSIDPIHERIQMSKNTPRLYSLISPEDPKPLPTFYKAVGNTLVADNHVVASRRPRRPTDRLINDDKRWEPRGTLGLSSKLATDTVRPEVMR